MKLAVIRTGGKQYLVKEGDTIQVERLPEKDGKETVTFSDVLLVADKSVTVGKPAVASAKVTAKRVEDGKGPKVRSTRYKPKKRVNKTMGHRQLFTKVTIEKISA